MLCLLVFVGLCNGFVLHVDSSDQDVMLLILEHGCLNKKIMSMIRPQMGV